MLAASISTATFDRVRSSASSWMVPVKRSDDPRTFAITMCRTVKCAPEWLESMVQVLVDMGFVSFLLAQSVIVRCTAKEGGDGQLCSTKRNNWAVVSLDHGDLAFPRAGAGRPPRRRPRAHPRGER